MENNIETNESPKESQKKSLLNIPSAIVLAGVIIAGAVMVSNGGLTTRAAAPADTSDLVSEVTSEDFIRGNKNAPITLIEYADFSCHFCAQFHPELAKLVKDYGGRVRWVYRHLPIFNIDAAVASSCVGRVAGEDAFWSFSDMLFANQDKLNIGYYKSSALSLGVKEADYDSCVGDPSVKAGIRSDFTQNKILLGLNATPHTVIVDKLGRKFSFDGALPYDDVKAAIDALDK